MVTNEIIPPEQQTAFVEELKKQGFACNTQAEIDNFKETADKKDYKNYYRDLTHLENEVITFKTMEEIKNQGRSIMQPWMITYFGGQNL